MIATIMMAMIRSLSPPKESRKFASCWAFDSLSLKYLSNSDSHTGNVTLLLRSISMEIKGKIEKITNADSSNGMGRILVFVHKKVKELLLVNKRYSAGTISNRNNAEKTTNKMMTGLLDVAGS